MENQVSPIEEIWAVLNRIAAMQEQSKQEDERRRQEDERRRLDDERRRLEDERRRLEGDLRKQSIDFQMRDTDRRIKALTTELNGISKSNGDFAEEYFNNAFEQDNLFFAGKHYDHMKTDLNLSNLKSGRKDVQYDIVLYNDESIVIIEKKYKACKNDIYDVIRKGEAFRAWFPDYADHKIYLTIAAMSFLRNTIKNAENKGIAIIRQKGEKTIINDKNLIAY